MGVRFRKSFKIAPGMKLNFGKKGVSATVGGNGAHYTINSSVKKNRLSVASTETAIEYIRRCLQKGCIHIVASSGSHFKEHSFFGCYFYTHFLYI